MCGVCLYPVVHRKDIDSEDWWPSTGAISTNAYWIWYRPLRRGKRRCETVWSLRCYSNGTSHDILFVLNRKALLGLHPDNFALVPVILNSYRLVITMLYNKNVNVWYLRETLTKHAIADIRKSNQLHLHCKDNRLNPLMSGSHGPKCFEITGVMKMQGC